MGGQWKEVVRLAFKGQRFRDHALDLSAVTELSQFQNLVAETAKTLWRAANPDRERIPKNFEDRTRLCLRRIEDGSAVAPLEVYLEESLEPELFEVEPTEAKQAVELAEHVFRSIERDEPLPDNFPKSLIPEYEKFGESLVGDEVIEIALPKSHNGQTARVTTSTRTRLAQRAEHTFEDRVDLVGEVLEADVRQRRFQLWIENRIGITVSFSPDQESDITSALRDHRSVRLQVIGKGEFSSQGKPIRVTEVDQLSVQAVGIEQPAVLPKQSIEAVLAALAREVPEKDWQELPSDLTDNLDHYLYGTPKQ